MFMRILHALSQRTGRTGSGVFLEALAEAGMVAGHTQAAIVGIDFGEEKPQIKGIEAIYPLEFNTSKMPFDIVGMSDVMPYKSKRFSELDEAQFGQYCEAILRVIDKAIEDFKPDLVISNHLWVLSALIKENYPNIPLFCLCHGTDLRQIELAPKIAHFVCPRLEKIEYAFALNQSQQEQIMSVYGLPKSRVIVSGSGYDDSRFFPVDKPKVPPIHVVYVGKLSNAKGVPSLLNAWENLQTNEAKLSLIGGGSGIESEAIKAKVKGLNNVQCLGFVEQGVLMEYLQKSHILALPSFFEGLPLVVLEALSCGTRVVCTDLPGLRDFVGEALEKEGRISYIPLPPMLGIDTPNPEFLNGFESDLATALKTQFEALKNEKTLPKKWIKEQLADKTWAGLFERIIAYM
jgi:glycosyltransferase involved in cell wall biosynthesis